MQDLTIVEAKLGNYNGLQILENYEQASATNIILEIFRFINLKLTVEVLTSKQEESASRVGLASGSTTFSPFF